MGTLVTNIIGYIIIATVFLAVLKIISLPVRIIVRLLVNIVVGGIALGICSALGIGIVVKWWTIALTATLGLPGFFIAMIISFIV